MYNVFYTKLLRFTIFEQHTFKFSLGNYLVVRLLFLIFISHAWEDKPLVRRLEAELQAAGAKVWVDHAGIRGGDNSFAEFALKEPAFLDRITSYNVCYTKLLRFRPEDRWNNAGLETAFWQLRLPF